MTRPKQAKRGDTATGDLGEAIRKFEGGARTFRGTLGLFVSAVAIAMSLFHFYTAGFGILEAMKQRAVHIAFAFFLIFLIFPGDRKKKAPLGVLDVLMAVAGAAVGLYVYFNYGELMLRAGQPTPLDMAFGVLAVLVVAEATRRAVGMPLLILAMVFLVYAMVGPWMPGPLAHRGFSLPRIVEHLYLTTEGFFGIPVGVSATFVFVFILFGAILSRSGAGQFFIDLALAGLGWMKGGPAKAAVVSSGMLGSISGSSVANVVTTGTFTIPLMKKVGFEPHVAGGVEVAASTSGQIMPPIMGAAAFIMAEYTGIPYREIIRAAAIPAILNYLAILVMVHLEASKTGIRGIPRSDLPRAWDVLKRGFIFLVPVVGILYMLLRGFTPLRAAYIGIILAALAGFVAPGRRMTLRDLVAAFDEGARNALSVAAACAATGFIIGVVTLTGLGLRLSSLIISLAGGHLLLTLAFTMFASIVLGMGLPTTATYIVLATITAPALVRMGVPLIAAHLFVFYFGCAADDTPPVALAGYAAAGIAQADPIKTGIMGFKFDLAAFLLPFTFVLAPALILQDTTLLGALSTILTAVLGVFLFSAAIQGFLMVRTTLWERLALLGAALVLVDPGLLTDSIGILVAGLVVASQYLRRAQMDKAQIAAPGKPLS